MSEEKETPIIQLVPQNDAPLISAPTVEEASDQDMVYLMEATEKYLAKGLKGPEAELMARKDLEELKAKFKAQGEDQWNRLNKQFRTWHLIKDQIERALAFYSGEWEQRNKPHTLRFEFKMDTRGVHRSKKGEIKSIAAAELYCNYAIDGVWKNWFKKVIQFRHYREMKEGDQWKLELYEAAFREFILFGTTYMLMLDGYRTGRIEVPNPTGGEGTTGAGTSPVTASGPAAEGEGASTAE
jgi:hypothetical protein